MHCSSRRLNKRTLFSCFIILLLIPVTIAVGMTFFHDRKYYFIGLMMIVYTMIPFFMVFEGRKPQARELVLIAVLCAIGVAGRSAFFWIPQFKPVVALVIITGVCLGAESGFLVGAVTGFVSNFFFGQGPWTPWQMFSFGVIGFLAGILFQKGWLHKTRLPLCIFGGMITVVVYGGLMNLQTLLSSGAVIKWQTILAIYTSGLPFDLIHAGSTIVFLFFAANPMIEKLDRIKLKYGLIESER